MNTTVKVDGVGLNSNHFLPLGKEEAVKKMKADNILEEHKKDEAWAGKAFDTMASEMKKRKDNEDKAKAEEAKKKK